MGIVALHEFIKDWFDEVTFVEALSDGSIIFRAPDWDNGEVPVAVFVNVPCGISHRIEEISIPEPKPEKTIRFVAARSQRKCLNRWLS